MVRDCGRQGNVRNLCHGHYKQVRRGVDIAELKGNKKSCMIHDCDRSMRSKGLCQTHYKQYVNGLAFRPLWFGTTKRCVVPSCGRDHHAYGLCAIHFGQSRNPKSITNGSVACLLCAEKRGTQRCHVIPRREGGTEEADNVIPLCPTHHWCFDHLRLVDEEVEVLPEKAKSRYRSQPQTSFVASTVMSS